MNYSADTWFFIQLSEGSQKAEEIWKEIIEGKGRLVVSSIVIAETVKVLLRKNLKKRLNDFMIAFRSSDKINVVDVTKLIAEEAGRISYSYNIPITDAIITVTAILTDHCNILSKDSHYDILEKDEKIRKFFR